MLAPRQGDARDRPKSTGYGPILTILVALLSLAYWWGFSVDDVWITVRYANHLARGIGYRFNAGGPPTDGVTPLGYAHLLALFGTTPSTTFLAARLLNAAAWLVAAGFLGRSVDRVSRGRSRWLVLALVATNVPVAAWASSGMETGLVVLATTLAVWGRVERRELLSRLSLGLAAAFRPELAPLALAWALVPPRGGRRARAYRWTGLLLGLGPFVVVAACRWIAFGRVIPLSALAKRSDLTHGAMYAVACVLLAGLLAGGGWGRRPWIRGARSCVLVHLVAITVVGGDWMPVSRLVVPVLPICWVVWAHGQRRERPQLALVMLALALAGQSYVAIKLGTKLRRVVAERDDVTAQVGVWLQGSRSVGAVDIGWLSSLGDFDVLDFAGVTEPAVAVLPGGHTSKSIGRPLLMGRKVDTLVLLLAPGAEVASPWTRSHFARRVEQRVAAMDSMAASFRAVGVTSGRLRYLVLRKTHEAPVD